MRAVRRREARRRSATAPASIRRDPDRARGGVDFQGRRHRNGGRPRSLRRRRRRPGARVCQQRRRHPSPDRHPPLTAVHHRVARVDPHDPGPEVGLKRGEESAEAARKPIKVASGEVRFGTASWTDPTMTAAGVFYPEGASTAEDRLKFYAGQFSVVEVDATYYALPYKKMAETWVDRTPKDFVFDIKAHAIMTGQPTEVTRLPKAIREEMPQELKDKKRIYRKDMPAELLDEMYRHFREALDPLVEARKLAAVVVQFPKWIFPSTEARELILGTRERLGLPIAVEFRSGSWFNEKNA